jgi:vanillate monooxygenase ferredoxin subunit
MKTGTQRVRLARKSHETQDICSFELVAADGGALAPFSAGAHIDVHLDGGLVRPYSLCNDPRETHRYLIAVLREPASRGGSIAMHALRKGQEIEISEPRNHFGLARDAQAHLLLAGGIGITPILAMAEQLAAEGAAFQVHYCTRSVDRTAFMQRLRATEFAPRVQFHHDDGPAAQKLDIAALVERPWPGKHLYVCGPAGFMEAVLTAARSSGWVESSLHREYFAGAATTTDDDGAFDVQLASSGALIRVAADQSVVAALAAAGVQVPVSCEQGVCGTCVTRVLDGTPEHRDLFLTDAEHARGDCFTPCCSRALSPRLVLDL